MPFSFSHSIVDDFEAPAVTRAAVEAIRDELVAHIDRAKRLDFSEYQAILEELRRAIIWADSQWLEAENRVLYLIHEAGGDAPIIAALDAVSAHARSKSEFTDVIFISIPEYENDVKKYAAQSSEVTYYYRRYLKYSDMSEELFYMIMRIKELYNNVYRSD